MSDTETIEALTEAFVQAARSQGFQISADLRVSEKAAASLLALKPRTLKDRRLRQDGPKAVPLPVAGCGWSYRIDELARWIFNGMRDERTCLSESVRNRRRSEDITHDNACISH